MAEQLTGGINVYACCKTERCKAVPPGVKSDILCDARILHPRAEGLAVVPCKPGKYFIFRRGISCFFRKPFPGIHVQWQEQFFTGDRKSTRLNSSHANISYAV